MGDAHVLRYGQKVRLATRSTYAEAASASELAIGYYEKNGRHGILSCVPPLGAKLQPLFTEDEFLVLHPTEQRATGDHVQYGEPLVLVNQHGMVWNNKTGGITGYVGPRPRGVPGEMFVSFTKLPPGVGVAKSSKKDKDKADKLTASTSASVLSASGSASVSMSESLESELGPVCFGDSNVAITVVESNRHSQMFNKRLSNFKKPTSHIAGGYICCDGKGTELRFTIWPAKPKIEQISMLNKLITPYNYGQKIALPLGLLESTAKRTNVTKKAGETCGIQQAEIFFQLSNGAEAVLPGTLLQKKMLAHAKPPAPDGDEPESVFELPLRNGPGVVVVRLIGVAPRKMIGKLAAKNGKQPQVPQVKRGMAIFYRVSDLLRLVPVPIFALLYAVLTHYLWGVLNTMEDGLRREFVVLVLVMLPAFYVAVKVDHPFSALFQPPVFEAEVDDTDYSSISASGTLKLIVTEYRFDTSAQGSSNANGSVSRPGPAQATKSASGSTSGHSVTALEATGSVPMRFILAEKGDEDKALERYNETTEWRREEGVDRLLEEPSPHFKIIKENYPHYYHKRGKNGEPVYYEKPGKINLKALKNAGLTLDDLMHNYLMITEFLWQVIEQDDNRKGISVLDVDGIGISDFAGEAVEYVRKAASVSGKHYPERCAYIFVINVPSWFSMIWNTVKGMVDDVTREKVIIVRGKKKIFEALSERIPVENIPVEYGGTSDGKSPEEDLLFNLMAYVNNDEDATATNPIEEILKKKPIKH
ncbi:hypothetical protein PR001_g1830 [Phytophthora rubi]|uniref:CRAL-TRIO domain-containing protein n=1 Tax=Phytophthora rubi TaxID=129364 RepID=A0A6A3P688_9STRA|nr:hypothetical protein PR002_g1863 [Phytophthora rubi]KAE9051054.1 hypothetical protein PR001_g1830 [Phytophthora rubi]